MKQIEPIGGYMAKKAKLPKIHTPFSEWIEQHKKRLGIKSDREVGRRASVSPSQIYRIMSRGTIPNLAQIRAIAIGLGADPDVAVSVAEQTTLPNIPAEWPIEFQELAILYARLSPQRREMGRARVALLQEQLRQLLEEESLSPERQTGDIVVRER